MFSERSLFRTAHHEAHEEHEGYLSGHGTPCPYDLRTLRPFGFAQGMPLRLLILAAFFHYPVPSAMNRVPTSSFLRALRVLRGESLCL